MQRHTRACVIKGIFLHELFIPHEYWKDIANQFPQITKTFISDKIGRYKNEINRFRYDVLFETQSFTANGRKKCRCYKYQFGMCDFLNTNERAGVIFINSYLNMKCEENKKLSS